MTKRIITGASIVVATVAILIFANTAVFPLAWALLSAIAVYELYRALSMLDKRFQFISALCYASIMPIVCYYLKDARKGIEAIAIATMVYLLWQALYAVMFHSETPTAEMTTTSWCTLYITIAFSALSLIYTIDPAHGIVMLLPVFLGTWATDTCALFSGMLFGKHKLAPELSPQKTIEGSIGGVVGCIAVFVLYGLIAGHLTDLTPHYPALAISGLLVSVLSQVGDLFMSKIKREHTIKDFGTLFPGHGGVLDRYDSMLTIAPMHLLLCLMTGEFSLFA